MENNLIQILVSITLLFFVLLIIKEFIGSKLKKNFCAICGAVVLTWLALLILYWLGIFQNKIILALLIGESALGIFYVVERKVREKLKIFRLPFLLTLIFLAYLLLEIPKDIIIDIIFLIIIWIVFILIYLYRGNRKTKRIIKKLVKCCME